jgi:hypothetical protein
LGKALIAAGVALVCISILLAIIWNRPQVNQAALERSTTTGQAAHSAGAKVVPPNPKLSVEPKPSGPTPIESPNLK